MNKNYKTVEITEIKPYENNPRLNESAIESVKESIKQCGYISPIIVDENYVVLAGHTRLKALESLGVTEVEICIVNGLNEQQKKKYRLLDNKTSENALWDTELLKIELEDLDFDDFDFGFDMLTTSYIADIIEDDFVTHEHEKTEFAVTFTMPIQYEKEVTEYIKKNGKQPLIDKILKETGEIVEENTNA